MMTQQEKIIKSYWANKIEEKQQESFIKNYVNNIKIDKCFFANGKQIKNFKLDVENNRFILRYSLKGNNLKYYMSLLNTSFLFYNNCLMALNDNCWFDYKNGILKENIINDLKVKDEMKGGLKE